MVRLWHPRHRCATSGWNAPLSRRICWLSGIGGGNGCASDLVKNCAVAASNAQRQPLIVRELILSLAQRVPQGCFGDSGFETVPIRDRSSALGAVDMGVAQNGAAGFIRSRSSVLPWSSSSVTETSSLSQNRLDRKKQRGAQTHIRAFQRV